ncbi:MAG TPA: hypothetical protein DF383_01630 [Deltaproteobacteria bacterium]|nr:hypothetical protein [Deltaproteobacteria bacterium]
MPALAKWGYIFSFLLFPVGLILNAFTLIKYENHPQAKRLAVWGIFVSLFYLLFFVLVRFGT